MFKGKRKEEYAPHLTKDEFYVAQNIFEYIPIHCRKVYIRYMVDGKSEAKIAAELRVPLIQVKQRLQVAIEAIMRRTLDVAKKVVVSACENATGEEVQIGESVVHIPATFLRKGSK